MRQAHEELRYDYTALSILGIGRLELVWNGRKRRKHEEAAGSDNEQGISVFDDDGVESEEF